MPEGAALSWSFSDIVIRRKGRLAFGCRVPGCSLLYHGLRRDELCKLKVKDMQPRRGVAHLRVMGKGEKIRYVPFTWPPASASTSTWRQLVTAKTRVATSSGRFATTALAGSTGR